jgi:hypothetical protein
MIISRICEARNLLSLKVVSFLVGLRTYQHPCRTHWTEKKEAVDCRWILHALQLQGLRKPPKISVSCPGREPKESLTKYIKSLG